MIKAILFDLDGTLVQMPSQVWEAQLSKIYYMLAVENGYDGNEFLKSVAVGYSAMKHNKTQKYNSAVFMQEFNRDNKYNVKRVEAFTEEFYLNRLNEYKKYVEKELNLKENFANIRKRDIKIVLATNPVMPLSSINARLSWCGLNESDFDFITHYKNCKRTKNDKVDYYADLLKRIKVKPHEVLMVGNNVEEDMVAAKLGCRVFLVNTYLIDKNNQIDNYQNGTIEYFFENLARFIK